MTSFLQHMRSQPTSIIAWKNIDLKIPSKTSQMQMQYSFCWVQKLEILFNWFPDAWPCVSQAIKAIKSLLRYLLILRTFDVIMYTKYITSICKLFKDKIVCALSQ